MKRLLHRHPIWAALAHDAAFFALVAWEATKDVVRTMTHPVR